MPRTTEAFAGGGDWWAKKRDAIGREYAVCESEGRVSMEVYERARDNEQLPEEVDVDD